MGHQSCCVVDCKNTSRNSNCKFYKFPVAKWKLNQRKKWIAAVKRQNIDGSLWSPKPMDVICSEHFSNGEKSDIESSPNFAPTIFPSVYRRRKINESAVLNSRKSKKIYNERGQIAVTSKDLCDCLDENCPGCHFPCQKCNSNKCGHECRVNRKWMYDKIEIEGNDFVIKNVYKNK